MEAIVTMITPDLSNLKSLPSHRGYVEACTGFIVSGWCISSQRPEEPTEVEVLIDNIRVARTTTSIERPDIGAFLGSRIEAGFQIDLRNCSGRVVDKIRKQINSETNAYDNNKNLLTVRIASTGSKLPADPTFRVTSDDINRLRKIIKQEQTTNSNAGSAYLIDEDDCSITDVLYAFHLFLNRNPKKSENVSPLIGAPFRDVLSLIFDLDDFAPNVRTHFTDKGKSIEESLLTPLEILSTWVGRLLPLSSDTKRKITEVEDRGGLARVLLADTNLQSEFGALKNLRLAPDDRSGENNPAVREIIGVVDFADRNQIRGWALNRNNRDENVVLEIYLNDIFVGIVRCTQFRRDIEEIHGGTGKYGFIFDISGKHLDAASTQWVRVRCIDAISKSPVGGEHKISVDYDKSQTDMELVGQEIARLREAVLSLESRLPRMIAGGAMPIEMYTTYRKTYYDLSQEYYKELHQIGMQFKYRPLITIIMPTCDVKIRLIANAVESVRNQAYSNWELIISDDASTTGVELDGWLERAAAGEPRIKYIKNKKRRGIAGNTNVAMRAAKGEYIALVDHDDELLPDALHWIVHSLQERRYTLVYSDEDRFTFDSVGKKTYHTPHFKPDFDYDYLLSCNYVCHLSVTKTEVATAIGGFRSEYDGAQDHDFFLRIAERTPAEEIRHIPRILYSWHVTDNSFSQSTEKQTLIEDRVLGCVREHIARMGHAAQAQLHNDPNGAKRPFANRITWDIPSPAPSVAIIIPTRDRMELLGPCVAGILAHRHRYRGKLDILVADNGSKNGLAKAFLHNASNVDHLTVIDVAGEFNYAAINNLLVRRCDSEVLVFLNNDTLVITPDWINEMIGHAIRPDVGAVGARLLYEDGSIQHAGVLLGVEGVAGHEGVNDLTSDGGYFGRTNLTREVSAVTAGCLAMRRNVFDSVGGFDDVNLAVAFNDVDLCMKVRRAGYRIIYTPFATLYHFESKSRGYSITPEKARRESEEARFFYERWATAGTRDAFNDPFYNPHFERYARPFTRLRPPPTLELP